MIIFHEFHIQSHLTKTKFSSYLVDTVSNNAVNSYYWVMKKWKTNQQFSLYKARTQHIEDFQHPVKALLHKTHCECVRAWKRNILRKISSKHSKVFTIIHMPKFFMSPTNFHQLSVKMKQSFCFSHDILIILIAPTYFVCKKVNYGIFVHSSNNRGI